MLATPPSFVSLVYLLRADTLPSSRSSMKMLNKIGPSTDPWGTPLVTVLQPDSVAQMQPGWGFVSDTRVNCCKEKLGEHPAGLLLPLLVAPSADAIEQNSASRHCIGIKCK
uniref:Uncharacterized protein n=1 Tax=Anser cygnoides TaxID=8845 RepID=A0A8B9E4Y4_ANSCY